jgi:hypothetical protein
MTRDEVLRHARIVLNRRTAATLRQDLTQAPKALRSFRKSVRRDRTNKPCGAVRPYDLDFVSRMAPVEQVDDGSNVAGSDALVREIPQHANDLE